LRLLGTSLGLVLTTTSVASANAADEHDGLILDFDIDPTHTACNDEGLFRRAVAERVGYDPFRESADHKIEIHTTETQRGLIGSISWRDFAGRIEGERNFDSPGADCTALLNNMAFAVALQIQLFDSMRVAEPLKAEPEVKPQVVQRLATRKPAARESNTSVVRRRPYVTFGFGTEIGAGLLPHPNWMGALQASLNQGNLALKLGSEISLPQTWQQAAGSGFRSHLYIFSVAPCYLHGPVSICAIGRVGALSIQGLGVDEPRHSSGTAGWLGLRVGADLPIATHWRFSWQADAARNVSGYAVTLNEAPVWAVPMFAVTTGVYVNFSTE
jgi:hypothetical protein